MTQARVGFIGSPLSEAPHAADSGFPVVLHRRRVFVLPTRHGLSLALVLFVMLVGCINYNNSLGYMLTFLLASLGLVSLLHTYRNLAGLGVRGGRMRPVFAGQEAGFGICLDNRGRSSRPAVRVRYPDRADGGERREGVLSISIPADRVHCVDVKVRAQHRGWLRLGRVTLATRYPFGLVRAWSHVELPLACLVYPRPKGRQPLPPAASVLTAQERGTRGRGRGDFSGFRDYHPGDSPRHIHWKAVARDQGMPVKLFAGASAGDLQLRWEDAAGRDTESRLSQLCLWVLEAHRRGLRYALAIPGASVPPGNDEPHLHRCLEALALYGAPDA